MSDLSMSGKELLKEFGIAVISGVMIIGSLFVIRYMFQGV